MRTLLQNATTVITECVVITSMDAAEQREKSSKTDFLKLSFYLPQFNSLLT